MAADKSLGCRRTIAQWGDFKCPRHRLPSFVIVTFVAIISTLARCAAAEGGTPALKIDPHRLTVEVNTTNHEVTCKFEDSAVERAEYRYLWVDSQNNPLDNTSSVFPRITYNETTGKLTLLDAKENDTDEYTCYLVDYGNCTYTGDASGLLNCTRGTFAYKVYVMPDYTTDGIIIGAINGCLLVIFVICLIRSAVADRKRLIKYGQKL